MTMKLFIGWKSLIKFLSQYNLYVFEIIIKSFIFNEPGKNHDSTMFQYRLFLTTAHA